jgi:hypothetical protein
MSTEYWASFFSIAFLTIQFLHSGLDKLLNYKKELLWLRQKFSRSPLHNYLGASFFILTISEVISGALCAGGLIEMFFAKGLNLAIIGSWASCVTILMLIFGQRIRKDYSGAATLVPYFIVCVLSMYFLSIIH